MDSVKIGIIGGSGLYEIDGMKEIQEHRVKTPFGDPSDLLVSGVLKNIPMVFLPRHGRGHVLSPSEINYRANIFALKKIGVTHIVSISAVGSLKDEIRPGDFVVVDQFIDRTKGIRESTFFNNGIVAHIGFSDPVCKDLRETVLKASRNINKKIHETGTYVCIEGPQFSTRGESNLYRSWGASVIGMTNIPESKLAREAEICYSTLSLVTDYDCWKENERSVSVADVISTLGENIDAAKLIIKNIPDFIESQKNCLCESSLNHAIMTNKKMVSAQSRKKLDLIIGKYL